VDVILEDFVAGAHERLAALSAESDLFEAEALDRRHWLLHYGCTGLVRGADGVVSEAAGAVVGFSIADDFLRRVDSLQVLTWLGPVEAWHPNLKAPLICVGDIAPGTPADELAYRVFDVISYQSVTPKEDDALNLEACVWARRNLDRFPVDARPLKYRVAR